MRRDANVKGRMNNFVLFLLLIEQSQPPTPTVLSQTQQDKTNKKHTVSDTNNTNASNPAPRLNSVDSQVATKDQNKPSGKSEEAAPSSYGIPDWLITIFTGVLAAVSILQAPDAKSLG
jgi:hypothetical protein